MIQKEDFILEKLIEMRFADPVNALQLTKDYIIIGTMMGRITLYDIKKKSAFLLAELNEEEISGISYNFEENAFYVGIGDEEIKMYSADNLSNEASQSISIYETDEKHSQNCENSFVLLSPESLFLIHLAKIDEYSLNIEETKQEYKLKNFNPTNNISNNNENFKGELPMTNYSVPFDFDGKNFLWVEFLQSGNRKICKANIPSFSLNGDPKYIYKYELIKNNEIGHISFAKLLSSSKVFIVHSLNKCEIRSLNNDFTLLESFIHIGEEVYGFDILYEKENKEKNEAINNYIHETENIVYNKVNNETLEEKVYNNIKIEGEIIKRNISSKEEIKSNDYLDNRTNNKKKKEIDISKINIITLDIKGNVNLYKNKNEITLFNMYKLNSISQDLKDKQFFSMGYAYYIKTDLNYFCISSDHGCILIKINDK